jgi:hypothetical protein
VQVPGPQGRKFRVRFTRTRPSATTSVDEERPLIHREKPFGYQPKTG